MRRISAVAALAIAIAFVLVSRDGGAVAMTAYPLQNISNTDGFGFEGAEAQDANGNIIVVWADDTPGNYDIYATWSHDGGATWSNAYNMSVSDPDSEHPGVAAQNGIFTIAWFEDDQIWSRSSPDAGQSWSTFHGLGSAHGNAHPIVAASEDGDDVYIAWGDTTSPYAVQMAGSDSGGELWGSPQSLGESYLGAGPGLAVTADGHTYVSIVLQDGILIYRWPPGDFAPSVDTTIQFPAAGASLYPAEGITDGAVELLLTTPSVPRAVFYSYRSDNTWSDPVQLSANGKEAIEPNLMTDGNLAIATWTQATDSGTAIFGRVSDDGGKTYWDTAPQISGVDEQAELSRAVLVNGKAFVMYEVIAGTQGSPANHDEIRTVTIDINGKTIDLDELRETLSTPFGTSFGLEGTKGQFVAPQPGLLSPHMPLLVFGPIQQTDPPSSDIGVIRLGVTGDSSCDAYVDTDDLLAAFHELAGLELSSPCYSALDLDCSGAVDTIDFIDFLRHFAGLAYDKPAHCSPVGH
jgi:hypothetical protein